MNDNTSGARNPYEPPAAPLDLAPAAPAPAVVATGPAGIGGWLLLPLLALIVSPIRVGADLLNSFGGLFANDMAGWAEVAARSPALLPLLVFEVGANVALIVYPLVVLVYFLGKSMHVPVLMIAWYSGILAIGVIDFVWSNAAVPDLIDSTRAGADIARGIIGALIWIPYFLKSERVKNTFVR